MSSANDPVGFTHSRTPQPLHLSQRKRCVLTWVGSNALALVHGHVVWFEVRIDGIVLKGSNHLLDGIIDEDEADEGGEAFLCEAGDVLYNEAGIGGHQDKALESRVEADPEAKLHVVNAIASESGNKGSAAL